MSRRWVSWTILGGVLGVLLAVAAFYLPYQKQWTTINRRTARLTYNTLTLGIFIRSDPSINDRLTSKRLSALPDQEVLVRERDVYAFYEFDRFHSEGRGLDEVYQLLFDRILTYGQLKGQPFPSQNEIEEMTKKRIAIWEQLPVDDAVYKDIEDENSQVLRVRLPMHRIIKDMKSPYPTKEGR